MKIRVVSSKEEINTLNPDEEIVHLTFRPSSTDIVDIVLKCPQIKALQIPTSYISMISKSAKMYLKMRGIELLEGDVWNHRNDINEYYEVSEMYDCIKQYRLDGMPEEDIIDKIVRETQLSPSFVSFLVKTY